MLIVADNLHVIDPLVADALDNLDAVPIREMIRRCIQAGAQAIDINSGPLKRDPEARFRFLVQTVRAETGLPIILDTTNARALKAGLDACGGRAVINGFSLEPGKLETILPLAKIYDTDIIGYLLYPDSRVPIEADEMMAIAVDLFAAFSDQDLPADRLIIDPVITPVSWEDGIRHNQAVLSVLRSLPDLLGTRVRTIAGLSNLASGPAPRHRKIALESAFLPMLAACGLDLVLTNVLHAQTVETARICDALTGRKIFSWAGIEGI